MQSERLKFPIVQVLLISLTLELEGLSSGNLIVEVHSCNNITDFSPLRHCERVIIRECKGFREAIQLFGVKEFIFTPIQRQMIPEDL